jgi:thioredoxin reductase
MPNAEGTVTMRRTDVVIVGAGPNGLSVAAHLAQSDVPFRIFGRPMENWLTRMPRGMHLKSDGFASSLYQPHGRLTLGEYCRKKNLPYADAGLPVPLDTFCRYGLAFQQKFVPMLEQKMVSAIERSPSGFTVELDSGETVEARRVIVATGITNFNHLPPSLQGLPSTFVSHSSEHADLTPFRGKDVVVVGRGASATDIAVLLQEAGAKVRLVTRKATLGLNSPPSLKQRLLRPQTGLGPSWKSWFFVNFATLFRHLPEKRRLKWVQTHLGPAGCWFIADRMARVPQLLGNTPVGAKAVGNRVLLDLMNGEGRRQTIEADHVIAATGYRPALDRLTFLRPSLRVSIRSTANTPVLSSHFESSVPGLYFVGPIAGNSFGPLMRFAFGAKYAAPRLSRHLIAASGTRDPSQAQANRASDRKLGEGTLAQDGSRQ